MFLNWIASQNRHVCSILDWLSEVCEPCMAGGHFRVSVQIVCMLALFCSECMVLHVGKPAEPEHWLNVAVSKDISICACVAGIAPHARCAKSLQKFIHEALVWLWSSCGIGARKSGSTCHSSPDTLHLSKSFDRHRAYPSGIIRRHLALLPSSGPPTWTCVLACWSWQTGERGQLNLLYLL